MTSFPHHFFFLGKFFFFFSPIVLSFEWIHIRIWQKCGKLDEQVDLLKQKLRMIHQGEAFNGKPTKTARSHGRKFQVTVKQETSRILVFISFLKTPVFCGFFCHKNLQNWHVCFIIKKRMYLWMNKTDREISFFDFYIQL